MFRPLRNNKRPPPGSGMYKKIHSTFTGRQRSNGGLTDNIETCKIRVFIPGHARNITLKLISCMFRPLLLNYSASAGV